MNTKALVHRRGDDPVEDVAEWAHRPALRELVELFGGTWPTGTLAEVLAYLVEFSNVWDLRGGGSRLDIAADAWDDDRIKRVEYLAGQLGMTDPAAPTGGAYDVALVLGGLVTGCISRAEFLAALVRENRVAPGRIALLGSFRELQEKERELADTVDANARTEVALLKTIAATTFPHPGPWETESEGDPATSPRLASLVAHRPSKPETWVFAARSSEPENRPANTADTYQQAAGRFSFTRGARLLLVTTHIYARYQHWDAVRVLGRPFDLDIETIGTPPGDPSRRTFDAPWYTQEVRSTLRSAKALLDDVAKG